MTVAISKAAEDGAKAIICASTGNTSASAAAYAVRAGMVCAVLVPAGKIAMGKLAQALVHGARLLQIDGNFDDCLELARKLAADYPVALVNSVNRYRLQGQKTAAFEIVDALGRAPDAHCLPVGNAGNISAYWMGYKEYDQRPRMLGFQAAGAAPIVRGAPVPAAADHRHRDPHRPPGLLGPGDPQARDESGGAIEAVTDRQILAAYRLLAREEGVFVEPASAASVAGLLQARDEGLVRPGQLIVCTVTGNGLEGPRLGDLGRARAASRSRSTRTPRPPRWSSLDRRRTGPACPPPARTSVPASTRSAWPSASTTTSRSKWPDPACRSRSAARARRRRAAARST